MTLTDTEIAVSADTATETLIIEDLGPATDTKPAPRRPALLSGAILALVALAVVLVLGWNLSGGQLEVMETSSMCPAVCVGSLVADRPLTGPLHVGEMITFHPPGSDATTYTHDVFRIFPNGSIQTKGLGNPRHDPWLINRSAIVGKVAFTLWGLGWLLKALPLLAVGTLGWVVTVRTATARARRGWNTLWLTLLVVIPLWILRPLVSAKVISSSPDHGHSHLNTVKLVNTGLLPASFQTASGGHVSHIASTHVADVAGVADHQGLILIGQSVSLYWWGWTIVICGVTAPLAAYLWHAWRDGVKRED
jgi:hypothetical protein